MKIIAIFWCIDNTTRARTFDSWEELTKYEQTNSGYLVVAFKSKEGDFLIK